MGLFLNASQRIARTSLLALCTATLVSPSVFAGWSTDGSQILDPNGNPFVFRGVNHAHTWFPDRLNQSLRDIAATGANAVRVVLSNGTQWTRNNGADVANVIAQCKANKLVCVLEIHDSTGYGESAEATHISHATTYWLSSDIKAAIMGQEDYVIVNIANEPFGNNTTPATYAADTATAIKALRAGGLTHMLMVDGATWGQDWDGAMRDNAATLFAADTLKNTVFSVHMYEVYGTVSAVQNYLQSFVNRNLPIIVGEFGSEHNGKNVAEEAILQYAEDMRIGYLGWSWSGNGNCCVDLDIVNNFNAASLSPWGDYLVNSANGIRATSRLATHFAAGASSSLHSSSARMSSSSIAPLASSSLRSSSSATHINSSSTAPTEYSCNWYGTRYPLCTSLSSGWGWENNQSCLARATCASQPSPWGIEGAGASSSSRVSTSSAASSVIQPSSSTAVSSIAASSPMPSSRAASSTTSLSGTFACTYVVSNSWGSGFTGAIRVTNTGTTATSGWTASWQFSGSNRLTSLWNATLSGANPYSATAVSWNQTLAAGQTVEFGFQGDANGSAIETPLVTCR
jgi:mannan endo-1,4-beta-mannosidase